MKKGKDIKVRAALEGNVLIPIFHNELVKKKSKIVETVQY